MAKEGYGAIKEKMVLASLMKSMQPTKMAKDLMSTINQAYSDGIGEARKGFVKAVKKCQKKDGLNFEKCILDSLKP